jgi:type VI secretion system protein VasI
MVVRRSAIVMLFIVTFGLASCGSTPQVADQPAQTPVVITEVVTQIVTQVTTQVVTQVVTATPKPATPTTKATVAPTTEPTATPMPMGKWSVDHGKSSFDDSRTVVVSLDAEGDISGPYETYRPSIILRCKEKETEAYINIGMQPDVESGNYDGATIRYRFDKESAKTDIASKSTDNLALFLDGPQTYIAAMLKHDEMVFGFTPFNGSPAETTFDLRGLSEAIKPLREVCPI